MKASVDPDQCVGCEVCTDTCPNVFRMEDGIAVVYVDPVPSENEDCVLTAEDNCPVMAINHE